MRSHSSRRLTLAAFALVIGLAGCASGGGGSGGGGRANLLTVADMSEVQQLSVYQAIQRLRPRWLRQRSNRLPNVYIDGSRRTGGLDDLRSMRTSEVQEMQYLSGSDATTRFGTGNDGGAILVTTRR